MTGTLARRALLACFVLTLSGCVSREISLADKDLGAGHYSEALSRLQRVLRTHPDNTEVQTAFYMRRDLVLTSWARQSDEFRVAGNTQEALKSYQQMLSLSPNEPRALEGLRLLEQGERHKEWHAKAQEALDKRQPGLAQRLWQDILQENPADVEARRQLSSLRLARQDSLRIPPALQKRMTKPVSLEFRQVPIQSVLEVLSQASGLNFIVDPDIKGEQRATIFARDTTVEDSLNLLLSTNGLKAKPLNDTTILVFPSTKEKRQKYDDLIIKTFRLGSADPKRMSGLISAFIKSAEIFVDEGTRTLTIRDTQENLDLIERLISGNDAPEAEVVLEIKVLEVNAAKLQNLGIQYPTQVKASITGSNKVPGVIPLPEFSGLDRSNFLIRLGDPLAVLNLSQTDSNAKTLASPRIRVRSNDKAKVMVGDKVPVITTTNNSTSAVISENISYLDVGLKLEVQPEVHVNNDVSMNISLEVSDIAKQITSSTGLIAYQIGSRSANTSLRLRDGETQALAGLIRHDEKDSASRVPLLGSVPLLGKFFSNETKDRSQTELVLLITPHVVRGYPVQEADENEIMLGGEDRPGRPLRMRNGAEYSFNSASSPLKTRSSSAGTAKPVAPVAESVGPKEPLPVEVPKPVILPGTGVSVSAPVPLSIPVMAAPALAVSQSSQVVKEVATSALPAFAPERPTDTELESPATMSLFDPSLAKVRFSLVAPAQISVGQPFTVAIMGGSADLIGALAVSLQLPANMELLSSAAGSGLKLKVSSQPNLIRFERETSEAQLINGPFALLSLKATAPVANGKLVLKVDKAANAKGMDVLAYQGEPRTLTVVP